MYWQEQIGQRGALHAAQHHDAELLLGHHADGGGHSGRVSAVLPHELVAVVFDDPSHAVCIEVRRRDGVAARATASAAAAGRHENLRRMRLTQRGAADEPLAVHHAVVQLKPKPLRHVDARSR